jgi:hypothetical protein
MQLEYWADETIEIADDGQNDWMERERPDGGIDVLLNGEHVQRSKLRIDSRKWLLSKLKPERYGDSLKHIGDPDKPVSHKHDVEFHIIEPSPGPDSEGI